MKNYQLPKNVLARVFLIVQLKANENYILIILTLIESELLLYEYLLIYFIHLYNKYIICVVGVIKGFMVI